MPRLPAKVEPGDPITAEAFNAVAETLERFLNLDVAPGGPLVMERGATGVGLALLARRVVWAKLSGTTSPYSWTEVEPQSGGTWATFGGRAGTTNAYEVNSKTNLVDKVVPLRWTSTGDYRFQWIGTGCKWTLNVKGCFSGNIDGATVTLKQSGVTIASGTTNASGNVTLNVPAATYDVEILSPSGMGYATYTASTVSHSCNQTTNVTLSPDSSHICHGCCGTMPSTMSLTVNCSGGNTSLYCARGSDSLPWNATVSGWAGSYQNAGDPLDPTAEFRYRVACTSGALTLIQDSIFAGGTLAGSASLGNGTVTSCHPFAGSGVLTAGGTWTVI